MIRRILGGGVAGAVATVLMSAVIWGFKWAGIYKSEPAPEALSNRMLGRVTGKHARSGPARKTLVTLSHLGFGAGSGSVYGLSTRVQPPSVLTGTLFGIGLWLASYKGWIPGVSLMPPPEHDEKGRAVTMAVAHVVYGATLGWTTRRLVK